ncbi:MAG: cytochrome c3 family protein [Pseudomonadota bacterium]
MPANKLRFVLAAILSLLCLLGGPGTASASKKIASRDCKLCHTMHNEEDGKTVFLSKFKVGTPAVKDGQAAPGLLRTTCVGCHSSTDSGEYRHDLGGGQYVPIVFHTTGPANGIGLAGGDFYWVVNGDGKGEEPKDRYGHNVYGLSERDSTFKSVPGGDDYCTACHDDLTAECGEGGSLVSHWTGCQGCHVFPRHHKDTDAYRMLQGHAMPYPRDTDEDNIACDNYVIGFGSSKYEAEGDFNEYKGTTIDLDKTTAEWAKDDKLVRPKGAPAYRSGQRRLEVTHSISAFCAGCHAVGNENLRAGGKWVRHPADVVIPAETFNDIPGDKVGVLRVARDKDTAYFKGIKVGSGAITAGEDLVMCLTCHRAHGSKYPYMLRWEYRPDVDQADTGGSCISCHVPETE